MESFHDICDRQDYFYYLGGEDNNILVFGNRYMLFVFGDDALIWEEDLELIEWVSFKNFGTLSDLRNIKINNMLL